jgi:hypothetical protein
MALYFDLFQRPRRAPTLEEVEEEKKFLPPPEEVEEEEQFLPPSEEVETVSSPSFSRMVLLGRRLREELGG